MQDFTASSASARMLVQSGTMGTCLEIYQNKKNYDIDAKTLITCNTVLSSRGIPAWLRKYPGMQFRTNNQQFKVRNSG